MSVDRFSREKIYLLDGGMGSLLQKKGLPPGRPRVYEYTPPGKSP